MPETKIVIIILVMIIVIYVIRINCQYQRVKKKNFMPRVRNFFAHIIFKDLFWIVKNEISTWKIITLNEEECNKFFD